MRIIDLFSGVGGLTFGFYYKIWGQGFAKNLKNKIVFANEFDEKAAKAYSSNYPDVQMLRSDIKTISDFQIHQIIGEQPIDLLIGGPPCQSFSTIGKRQFDDKAKLYLEYLRIIKTVSPKMFIFENVKGMLSMHEQVPILNEEGTPQFDNNGSIKTEPGRLIIDIIKEALETIGEHGYEIIGKEVLDAQNYGIPQHRERVIIIGVRKDLRERVTWDYPPKTHGKGLAPVLTIKDAISDLPSLQEGERKTEYTNAPSNEYQFRMRKNSSSLTHHYCGIHNEKMKRIIAAVPQGEGKPYINDLVKKGLLPPFCKLTSGYDNTYGRLREDIPSTTITNNMCTPSALRCIHYDQNRELSPREGARIQSFPDWFSFFGGRADVTKQIGNAVPPLLAIQLARQIEKAIERINANEQG